MCSGTSDSGVPCNHALVNKRSLNDCMDHPDASLIQTGACKDSVFLYISPENQDDKRRWLGCLSISPKSSVHSHPPPAAAKITAQVKEAIIVALEKDPSITADDISKGNSIGFNPMIASPATAHKDTLSNFVKMIRTKFDCSGYSCRNTIEQFDAIVKANIDEIKIANWLRAKNSTKGYSTYPRLTSGSNNLPYNFF